MMLTLTIGIILLNKQKYLNKTIQTYSFASKIFQQTKLTKELINSVPTKGIYLDIENIRINNKDYQKLKLDILKHWNLTLVKDFVALQIDNQIYTHTNTEPDFMLVLNKVKSNSGFALPEIQTEKTTSDSLKENLMKNLSKLSLVSINGYTAKLPEHKDKLIDFLSDLSTSIHFLISIK